MASKRKVKKASAKPKKKAAKVTKTKAAVASKKSSKKTKPKPVAKVAKGKAAPLKAAPRKAAPKVRKGQISRSEKAGTAVYEAKGLGAASGGQSGDLQGISDIEGADSESVQELLEEGSSFEAEVVAGVEGAADEEEVHTHEVNEDDVPEEYLERDK